MPDPLRARHFLAALLLLITILAVAEQPDPRYWRLDDIKAQFDTWELAYPDIFHQTILGTSGQGEAILLARISDNATVSEPEPSLFFHGALHANECNGTGAVMRQMSTLLAGYGVDPEITARVDGLEIWFTPILNPDGHRYVFSGAASWDEWRKTLRDNNENGQPDFPADGVDLNRNWDWRWQEYDDSNPSSQKYKGPYPWSEPEIVAVRNFVLTERPVIVADYHSPVTIHWSNYIFYPWVSTNGLDCPDLEVSREVALDWAAATRTQTGAPYHTIFAYDTLPKEQCWIYGNTGILAYIMEISDQCWWTGAVVDTIAARVARGSVALLDRTLDGPGLMGTVTHDLTGEPVVAEVKILELHDDAIGPRYSESGHGQYYRPTQPGNYTVEVSLRGYETQTMAASVSSAGWTVVDVALAPIITAAADVLAAETWLQIGDTVRGGRAVRLRLPVGSLPARVDLFDPRGRRLAVLGDGLMAERTHELRLPSGLADGVYLVRAHSGGQQQVARLVFLN